MAIERPRLNRLLSDCAMHKLRGVNLTPSKSTYGLCRVPFSFGHFGGSTRYAICSIVCVLTGLDARVLTTPARLVKFPLLLESYCNKKQS